MPSKTKAQAKLMAACAHGADYDACPPKDVAKEFNTADKKTGILKKTFKEWIEEQKAYKQQASSTNYPVPPIRKPEDLSRASKGDNFETIHFDAIRHNAKIDAEHIQKHGTEKEKADNKKMQHAGELHLPNLFNPSHPDHKIENAWFKQMSPHQQRHVLSQHKEKQLADWKERNGAS